MIQCAAMEQRAKRIVMAAIELAEKGGFEGVRLRDVAAHADVALGTLYRRFRSKEELLLGALELQMEAQEQRWTDELPTGATPADRPLTSSSTSGASEYTSTRIGLPSGTSQSHDAIPSVHDHCVMRGSRSNCSGGCTATYGCPRKPKTISR